MTTTTTTTAEKQKKYTEEELDQVEGDIGQLGYLFYGRDDNEAWEQAILRIYHTMMTAGERQLQAGDQS